MRAYWLAIAVLLGVMALVQVSSVRQESQTFDESVHLAAGYRYWKTGAFEMNREHPPLQKLLSALPLLVLRPELPAGDPTEDQYKYAGAFLYRNRIHADTLLFAGRLVTIALTLCLGAAIAWWTAQRYGPGPGLLAVLLYAFEPNVIAHGRYITTDLIAALFFFLSCALWSDYLEKPGARRLLWTGLSLGAALAAKFSMVLLLPLLSLVGLVRRGRLRTLAAYAAVCALAFAATAAVYAPETIGLLTGRREAPPLKDVADRTVTIGYLLKAAGHQTGLPAHSYLIGLQGVAQHNKNGNAAYLLGRIYEGGDWRYFPVALAVKATTGFLVLLALSVGAGLWLLVRTRRIDFPVLVLLAAVLAYFGMSLTSRLNFGVRHLFPIFPLLCVLIALAAFRAMRWKGAPVLVALLALAHAGESLAAYPDYVPFFNVASGGSASGSRYLLDSNLDWGQDLKKLKQFVDERGVTRLCLHYFGMVDPAYYGLDPEYLPKTHDRDERERTDCYGAVSVTLLHDLYLAPGSYAWLRERTPIARVGGSIYVYDLRRR